MTVRSVPMLRPTAAGIRANVSVAWLPPFARDFGLVVGVILVYFLLRGQAPGNHAFAVALTWRLVEFERAAGVFWEPAIQHWSIHFYWTKETANFVYAYGHFPVLAAVGAWLWFRSRDRFLLLRNTMFVSMVFGLAFYYLLPAAPPRLLAANGHNLGFVDTIFGGNTSVSYAQPSLILNNYAAIPSFHFGWIALASAAIWFNTSNRLARLIAVLLTVVMGWAIVASANHLLADMVLGAMIVALSWWLAQRHELRAGARRLATAA